MMLGRATGYRNMMVLEKRLKSNETAVKDMNDCKCSYFSMKVVAYRFSTAGALLCAPLVSSASRNTRRVAEKSRRLAQRQVDV